MLIPTAYEAKEQEREVKANVAIVITDLVE